jgi:hypothetical protein
MEDQTTLEKPEAAPSADPAPAAATPPAQPDTNTAPEGEQPAAPQDAAGFGLDEPTPTEVPEGEIVGDTDDDSRKVEVPADWPEDWRSKLANGDEKLMKRLERFSSPDKILQSWLAAEQKISSGEYKAQLPEDASEEQVAEWRKEQGIPEAPDKYELPQVEGAEWDDHDRQLFNQVFERMHAKNATQEQVDAMVTGYVELVDNLKAERADADRQFLQEQEDALRTRLGDEYRPQINVFKRVLEDPEGPVPQNVVQSLMNARDENGNKLINNAEVAQFLIEQGLNHYGDGALISGDAKATMTSRMDEIKQVMKTDFDRYLREGMDQEYAKLLERSQGRQQSAPSYYD